MTSLLPKSWNPEVFYPSSDGEPLAETSVHIDAIINAVVALRHYLSIQPALVLADQFLYYAEGFPKLRVAPDIMVIFDVPPGPRDHYKTWAEGQSPAVIFEITSASTRDQDDNSKRHIYEQLEIPEYWQFDPHGEWIPEQLRGYRLESDAYRPITDGYSQLLKLRLEADGGLIAFYRENGQRLPAPSQLIDILAQETSARQAAERELEQERQRADQESQRANQAESEAERLREKLRSLGIEPDA
jgi:Uma2 family endonuclease